MTKRPVMRAGILIPPTNAVLEPEFYAMGPPGLTFHIARFVLNEARGTVATISDAADDVMNNAFKYLPKVDLVVVGVTAPTFIKGVGWDKVVAKKIEDATKIPVVTTSTAVIEALKQLKIKNVAIGTPYLEATQEKLREFLEGNGLNVVSSKSIRYLIGDGPGSGYLQPDIPLEAVIDLGKDVDRPEADGILISCANLRTIEVIESLERDLGKPIVTSNQATMWAILNKLGLVEPRNGYGKLLRREY